MTTYTMIAKSQRFGNARWRKSQIRGKRYKLVQTPDSSRFILFRFARNESTEVARVDSSHILDALDFEQALQVAIDDEHTAVLVAAIGFVAEVLLPFVG